MLKNFISIKKNELQCILHYTCEVLSKYEIY